MGLFAEEQRAGLTTWLQMWHFGIAYYAPAVGMRIVNCTANVNPVPPTTHQQPPRRGTDGMMERTGSAGGGLAQMGGCGDTGGWQRELSVLHETRLPVIAHQPRQLRDRPRRGAAALVGAEVVEGVDGLLDAQPVVDGGGGFAQVGKRGDDARG